MEVNVIDRRSAKEFRETGLLWFINSILHMFGWAIVWNNDEIYPARVKYRGFEVEVNDKGYINVTKYLKENIDDLLKETEE
jgi:hypothetical protein